MKKKKKMKEMKEMKETKATYFCIDIEANGPVPGLYDMVSLGAVAVPPDENGALSAGEDFYVEIIPEAPRVDEEAEAIHGLSREYLARHGIPLADACLKLEKWVKSRCSPGTKPVFVGHNAPFDWSFVAWSYASIERENPFGYKALCTKSLAAGALNLHWFDSGKETIAKALGMEVEDHSRKHRADYDARYQAELLVNLLAVSDEQSFGA